MMFLHGGWLHLILNMWTLWLFGPTVEDRMGHARYLAFYLACGLAASVAHVMFNPTSIVPALGASGAIAGILGCYMRLFPMARVVVVVPILFIPLFFEVYAFVFIGLWFLIQVLQSMMALLAAGCQRRRGVVGPCRRVYRRVRTWPVPGPVRAALPRILPGRRRVRLRYQGANMKMSCHRRIPCRSVILSGFSSYSRRSSRCCSRRCSRPCGCARSRSSNASENRE